MPIVDTYNVQVQGIGRADYSNAVEITTEAVITSWQDVYSYSALVTVPAAGNLVVDIPVGSDLVVIIYDYFASIPSNRLIRLEVDAIDSVGAVATIFRQSKYQTIAAHISKGRKFRYTIRYRLYNYAPVPETEMRIGAAGIFTTAEEFYLSISPPAD